MSSQGLAYRARLQEARGRWLNELAVQESNLAGISRPGKVARGTSEVSRPGKFAERGGSANSRCRKVVSQRLADPVRLQEARAKWLGELVVQESKLAQVSRPGKFAERGGSANSRCRKVVSQRLADPVRLQEARAKWLGELVVQESKLAQVSRPGKFAERGGSANSRCRKVVSQRLADPVRLQEARAKWLGELVVQESKLAQVSRPGKFAERGGSANSRCRKVVSQRLADPVRLQEARAKWLGELVVQESKLAQVSRPGKFAERGGSANSRCRKVVSQRLADPVRLQEARAKWLGELVVQESKLAQVSRPGKFAERGGSANSRCRKVVSQRLADPVRLQEARAKWLGELVVQESKLAQVSRPGKFAERGGSANSRCRKVVSQRLADPVRLQEARAKWLGELVVQESKLAQVSRPGKFAERGGSANSRCRKVVSQRLADPVRLQEARAKWLGELVVQESKLAQVSRPGKFAERGGSANSRCRKVVSQRLADPVRLQEARAKWLGELVVQESKLAQVSRPGKFAERGGSANSRCRKVVSQRLADPVRLQEARAKWLGELVVQESKLAQVSRPGKFAERGGSANSRCRKVVSQRLADPVRLQEARAKWLGELVVQESKLAQVSRPGKFAERGGSANSRCRKVVSQRLADPVRLQEARAKWLGELVVQESKLAQVSRPGKFAERGGSANSRCRKVVSQRLADPVRLQEARAKWLGELVVQESKLAQVSRPGKFAERGGSANSRCRKVVSQRLADPVRLQEARAKWLGELVVQESKLAQVSRPGKFAERGGSANSRCRKVVSQRLADPVRLQEARAKWLGELVVQESKLAQVSRPGKFAERGGSANSRCRKVVSQRLADPVRLQEARAKWLGELVVQESKLAQVSRPGKFAERGGSANSRCRKVVSQRLADPVRLQEARAKWLGELVVQESKLAQVSRPGKFAERGGSANSRCRKVVSQRLADPVRLQEARAKWLGELVVQESKLVRVSRPRKVAEK
ncbi:hypothetical protein CRG98_030796 [Punica granatum]|uniref:Uncharacterized protein n=1 Tax=Punica granatum TaxID=22663 RepID=A0A2I0IXV1_PUNGR|nr:hypothetical protein CRG98_030796 [Punica granatum]